MNFLIIFLLAVTAALNGTQREQNALAQIKEKWLAWANEQVETKKREFSDQYLNPGDLEIIRLPLCREDFKEAADHRAKKALNQHVRIIDPKNIDPNDEELKGVDLTPDPVNEEKINNIIQQVFQPSGATIFFINNKRSQEPNVHLYRNYKNNTCCVELSASYYTENPQYLKPILLHEYAHFIHEDFLDIHFLHALAATNPKKPIPDLPISVVFPIMQIDELSADLYSAANSEDHGAELINWLKAFPDDEEITTHPQPSERIALLEQMKAELDAAATL